MIGDPQRGARILLHQQDRDAIVPQRRRRAQDLGHDEQGEAKARLVQHQQAGLAHQRAGHGEYLAFPVQERARPLLAPFAQMGNRAKISRSMRSALPLRRSGSGSAEIVLRAHGTEKLALLRHQAHAAP